MTETLYDLAKKSKEDSNALETIVKLFEPKLKKSLSLTEQKERDDLSQELKYKLVSVIKKYDVDSTPGFWELKEQMMNEDSFVKGCGH
ncbi:helix-turn-helix domain-containing protein [Virgibacillus halodenitrificans]|uniref:helix-turn-helix domain-containing protein n=1 Tax=Virgibacillus halodenitrificans TaxID=1482 RepID=UPI000EF49CD8|nr:helix-turn-helix domain-containing protein [Virgibacillus halodenitrificans]